MPPLKELLYDWLGANDTLFLWINYIHGNFYDDAMLLLTRIADYHNFPYYLGAIMIYALLSATIRKMKGQSGVRTYLATWFGVVAVLVIAFGINAVVINHLKDEFHYPRPYIALASEPVRVLDPQRTPESDYHSFPSGHASFITLMVVGMWPVLTEATWWLALLLIPAVCWSRIAVGMHFPADVVSAALIAFVIVMLVRAVIYTLLLKIFKMRC